MFCPKCGKKISDEEKICPYCNEPLDSQDDTNEEDVNDYDFVLPEEAYDEDAKKNETIFKRFTFNEANILKFAIIFVLVIALLTIIGLRLFQVLPEEESDETEVTQYTQSTTEQESTSEETKATETENAVKNLSIKYLYGSWRATDTAESDSSDSAIPYYSFWSDGKAQINYGSVTYTGKFTDKSKGDDNIVKLNISSSYTGTYYFEITGNKDDGYSLVLTDTSTHSSTYFTSATAKSYKLGTISDYKIDKKLLGKWVNSGKTKSYKFSSDGRMVRVSNNMTLNGVWTINDDGNIMVKYMRDTVKTTYLGYNIDGDELEINSTIYTKK